MHVRSKTSFGDELHREVLRDLIWVKHKAKLFNLECIDKIYYYESIFAAFFIAVYRSSFKHSIYKRNCSFCMI